MTPREKQLRAALEVLLEASMTYDDVTSRGESAPCEALYAGARLRIAAKAYARARRDMPREPQ